MRYLLYYFEKSSAWVFGTSIHSFMWVYYFYHGVVLLQKIQEVADEELVRYDILDSAFQFSFRASLFYVFLSFDLCGSLSFFQDISGLGAKGIHCGGGAWSYGVLRILAAVLVRVRHAYLGLAS